MVSSRKPNYQTKVKTRNFEAMVLPFVTPDRSHQVPDMERPTLSGVNEQSCALEMQSSLVIEKVHRKMEILEVHSQSQEQAGAKHGTPQHQCKLTCIHLPHLQLSRAIHRQLYSRLVLPPLLPPLCCSTVPPKH
jgi:hypothetical protein